VFIDHTATPESALDPALIYELKNTWKTNYETSKPTDLTQRLAWIRDAYEFGSRALTAIGVEPPALVAISGSGQPSGHAYRTADGAYAAWIDASAIATPMRARFFVLHDLIHAAHYARNPHVTFGDAAEFLTLGRRIWSEGVASFLVGTIMRTDERDACWADAVEKPYRDRWRVARAREEFNRIRQACREWESAESDPWFVFDPEQPDISRIGTYTGFRMARFVRSVYLRGDADLLSVHPNEVRALRW